MTTRPIKTNTPKHRFIVNSQVLSDGSRVFDISILRGDRECLVIIEAAISEGHAHAICDDLNKVLELRGVYA